MGLCSSRWQVAIGPMIFLNLTISPRVAFRRPLHSAIDWKKAEAKTLEAPWKPKIKSSTDASNFDEFDDDARAGPAQIHKNPCAPPRAT